MDRGASLLKVDKLVTGHNADDIAETVLLNILRGDIARYHHQVFSLICFIIVYETSSYFAGHAGWEDAHISQLVKMDLFQDANRLSIPMRRKLLYILELSVNISYFFE